MVSNLLKRLAAVKLPVHRQPSRAKKPAAAYLVDCTLQTGYGGLTKIHFPSSQASIEKRQKQSFLSAENCEKRH